MAKKITAELMAEAPQKVVAQLLGAYAENAVRALDGLENEPQALHDFRVSLRRMRSTLRAYRNFVEPGPKEAAAARKLKKIARKTNRARDIQVASEWLAANLARFTAADRGDHIDSRRLSEWFHRRQVREMASVKRYLQRNEKKLRRLLKRWERRSDADACSRRAVDFRAALRFAALEELADLHRRLDSMRSAADAKRLHRARIAAKRLRYAIEPTVGAVDGTKELVDKLKGLQDLSGRINDSFIIEAQLRKHARRAGAEYGTELVDGAFSADENRHPGAVELSHPARLAAVVSAAQVLADDRQRDFESLRDAWLGRHAADFRAQILTWMATELR